MTNQSYYVQCFGGYRGFAIYDRTRQSRWGERLCIASCLTLEEAKARVDQLNGIQLEAK